MNRWLKERERWEIGGERQRDYIVITEEQHRRESNGKLSSTNKLYSGFNLERLSLLQVNTLNKNSFEECLHRNLTARSN